MSHSLAYQTNRKPRSTSHSGLAHAVACKAQAKQAKIWLKIVCEPGHDFYDL